MDQLIEELALVELDLSQSLLNLRQELGTLPNYHLHQSPSQRFWKPNDPVVLFAGDDMQISPQFDENIHLSPGGYLDCRVLDITLPSDADTANVALTAAQGAYPPGDFPIDANYATQRYPLLMDWLVEFFPTQPGTNENTSDGYPTTYLEDNYELDTTEKDLELTGDWEVGAHNYWGSTILSAHAGAQLKQNLARFITNRLLKMDLSEYPAAQEADWAPDVSTWDQGQRHDFMNWFLPDRYPPDNYPNIFIPGFLDTWDTESGDFTAFFGSFVESSHTPDELNDFHLAIALLAFDKLSEKHYLSQSLGGFTQGLLMQTLGHQLEVANPLGFDNDKDFAAAMAAGIGPYKHYSVLPRSAFFPLRAGALTLVELRLIDHFGLELIHQKDIENTDIDVSEPLLPPSIGLGTHHANLPARFSQASRLNFRWLSALDDDLETNDHPATTPICGWILVNEFDQTIQVHSTSGEALGSIDQEGQWRIFPGHDGPVIPAGIDNPQLRRLVNWLLGEDNSGREAWINQINAALDQVEPDNFEQHDDLALLMSRPIALVRAAVQWETHGQVAINHGWNEFRSNMHALDTRGQVPERDRHGVENLQIQVRLGEASQLNDGLIGFFVDNDDGSAYRNDKWHTPTANDHTFDLSIQLDPYTGVGTQLNLNMLMDPRGAVHATTGLQPVQSLAIPADQFRAAMSRFQIAFFTAPLLTPDAYLHLSVPEEPGQAWSWLSRRRTHWSEVSTDLMLRFEDVKATFQDNAEAYWGALIERGWIEAITETQAQIVPLDQRPDPPDGQEPWPTMEAFLNRFRIGNFQTNVAFGGQQVIQEGWLKLRPQNTNPDTDFKNLINSDESS